ncbi:MAG: response regulator transcription factor [Pseudolysinimonas sp.]
MRTVLIVDDHDSFRAWARRVLSDEGFDVIGEAPNGASAISLARDLRPDIVLLDMVLPDMTGVDVAAEVGTSTGATIVLTSSRDLADFGIELRSPVAGFLPKAELSGLALERLVGR